MVHALTAATIIKKYFEWKIVDIWMCLALTSAPILVMIFLKYITRFVREVKPKRPSKAEKKSRNIWRSHYLTQWTKMCWFKPVRTVNCNALSMYLYGSAGLYISHWELSSIFFLKQDLHKKSVARCQLCA